LRALHGLDGAIGKHRLRRLLFAVCIWWRRRLSLHAFIDVRHILVAMGNEYTVDCIPFVNTGDLEHVVYI
jgi:hypothetical protein